MPSGSEQTMLFGIFAVAASAAAATANITAPLTAPQLCNNEQCCGSLPGNIVPIKPVNRTQDIALNVGQGWQTFFFGTNGTWAKPTADSDAMYLEAPVPMLLRITDAYIPGDRFALFVNGSLIGRTSLPLFNSSSYTTNPDEAFVNSNYSSGSWLLPKGLHRLTIQAFASRTETNSSSTGFIRADVNPYIKCGKCRPLCHRKGPCVCFPRPSVFNPPGCCANSAPLIPPFGPMCKEASGRYLMIKNGMSRDEGVEACRRMNMRLAAINTENFVGVNEFAFLCNNQQVANSWVESWNGDNYDGTCLVMQSAQGGLGAITAGRCHQHQSVLCEA